MCLTAKHTTEHTLQTETNPTSQNTTIQSRYPHLHNSGLHSDWQVSALLLNLACVRTGGVWGSVCTSDRHVPHGPFSCIVPP